jgi:hypothetical protein
MSDSTTPQDSAAMPPASTGYPFSYHLLMTCKIAGKFYEFSKEWRSPTQHSAGDLIHVGELGGVKVTVLMWYIDDPGHAFIELEDTECEGAPEDWAWLLKHFDHSTPDLIG